LNLQIIFNSYYIFILYYTLLFSIEYPSSVFGIVMLTSLIYQLLFLFRFNKREINYISMILFLFSSFYPLIYGINYLNNISLFTVFLTIPLVGYTVFFPIINLLSLFNMPRKSINPLALPLTFLILFIYISFMNGVFKTGNITLENIQNLGVFEVYSLAQFFYLIYSIINNIPINVSGKNILEGSIPNLSSIQISSLVIVISLYLILSIMVNRIRFEEELKNWTIITHSFLNLLKSYSIILIVSVLASLISIYFLYIIYANSPIFMITLVALPLALLLINLVLNSK